MTNPETSSELVRRLGVAADGIEKISFERRSIRRGYENLLREAATTIERLTARALAAEERLGRYEVALKDGLSVTQDGEVLSIRISADTLATAIKYMPKAEIFDEGLQDFFQPEITDQPAFLKEMANALQHEEEDGTTLVHRMLDKAALHIMHVGGEGVLSAQEVRDRARTALHSSEKDNG